MATHTTKSAENTTLQANSFFDIAASSELDPMLLYVAKNLQNRLHNPQVVSYKCFNEGCWVHMVHHNPAPKFCVSCGSSNIDRYHNNYRPVPDWYPDARRYVEKCKMQKHKILKTKT